ncbi:hypothetical protein BJ742DRAFT_742756 [Cladochytrium replicatum]|nr:hypothetical protein BJ742DRAFT_742756 [Cladochytrium replicatum]
MSTQLPLFNKPDLTFVHDVSNRNMVTKSSSDYNGAARGVVRFASPTRSPSIMTLSSVHTSGGAVSGGHWTAPHLEQLGEESWEEHEILYLDDGEEVTSPRASIMIVDDMVVRAADGERLLYTGLYEPPRVDFKPSEEERSDRYYQLQELLDSYVASVRVTLKNHDNSLKMDPGFVRTPRELSKADSAESSRPETPVGSGMLGLLPSRANSFRDEIGAMPWPTWSGGDGINGSPKNDEQLKRKGMLRAGSNTSIATSSGDPEKKSKGMFGKMMNHKHRNGSNASINQTPPDDGNGLNRTFISGMMKFSKCGMKHNVSMSSLASDASEHQEGKFSGTQLTSKKTKLRGARGRVLLSPESFTSSSGDSPPESRVGSENTGRLSSVSSSINLKRFLASKQSVLIQDLSEAGDENVSLETDKSSRKGSGLIQMLSTQKLSGRSLDSVPNKDQDTVISNETLSSESDDANEHIDKLNGKSRWWQEEIALNQYERRWSVNLKPSCNIEPVVIPPFSGEDRWVNIDGERAPAEPKAAMNSAADEESGSHNSLSNLTLVANSASSFTKINKQGGTGSPLNTSIEEELSSSKIDEDVPGGPHKPLNDNGWRINIDFTIQRAKFLAETANTAEAGTTQNNQVLVECERGVKDKVEEKTLGESLDHPTLISAAPATHSSSDPALTIIRAARSKKWTSAEARCPPSKTGEKSVEEAHFQSGVQSLEDPKCNMVGLAIHDYAKPRHGMRSSSEALGLDRVKSKSSSKGNGPALDIEVHPLDRLDRTESDIQMYEVERGLDIWRTQKQAQRKIKQKRKKLIQQHMIVQRDSVHSGSDFSRVDGRNGRRRKILFGDTSPVAQNFFGSSIGLFKQLPKDFGEFLQDYSSSYIRTVGYLRAAQETERTTPASVRNYKRFRSASASAALSTLPNPKQYVSRLYRSKIPTAILEENEDGANVVGSNLSNCPGRFATPSIMEDGSVELSQTQSQTIKKASLSDSFILRSAYEKESALSSRWDATVGVRNLCEWGGLKDLVDDLFPSDSYNSFQHWADSQPGVPKAVRRRPLCVACNPKGTAQVHEDDITEVNGSTPLVFMGPDRRKCLLCGYIDTLSGPPLPTPDATPSQSPSMGQLECPIRLPRVNILGERLYDDETDYIAPVASVYDVDDAQASADHGSPVSSDEERKVSAMMRGSSFQSIFQSFGQRVSRNSKGRRQTKIPPPPPLEDATKWMLEAGIVWSLSVIYPELTGP